MAVEQSSPVLSECVRLQKTAQLVLFSDPPTAFAARFVHVSAPSLTFDVTIANPADLQPPQLCSIVFAHDNQRHFSVGRVRSAEINFEAAGDRMRAQIDVLQAMNPLDGRSAFRIPISPEAGTKTRLIAGEREISAELLNLSLLGALIQVPASTPPLALGMQTRLLMNFRGGADLDIEALIRRRADSQYGLFFHHFLRDGEVQPSPQLRKQFTDLERQWLQTRRTGAAGKK